MLASTLPFRDGVRAIWVLHKMEQFVVSNEFVNKHFCVLKMDVIVCSAVDKQ